MTKKVSPRRAVYPGSFDPIHLGHLDIIQRIAKLFDEVIVLIAVAPDKNSLFSIEERKVLLRKALEHLPNVSVDSHASLTVDYMREKKAGVIIRGLRAVVDFEYEISMANMNRKLAPEIETMLVFASPEFYFISSRGVKEVARNNGSLAGLVPPLVDEAVQKRKKK